MILVGFGTLLQDVFYQEISETSDDYPFIRTECVIDTVQATTYLMEAIVNLYRAIDQRGQKCSDIGGPYGGGNDIRCAVNVIGFITCMAWVSAYLSLAASACAQAVNPGALCAADWTTIAGAFGEIAYAGAGVRQDCKIYGKWAKRKGYGLSTTLRLAAKWRRFKIELKIYDLCVNVSGKVRFQVEWSMWSRIFNRSDPSFSFQMLPGPT